MALFYPCMKIKNFLGQMPLFEVLRKCHLVILSKICLWLCPCAYLCGQKWINRIFSKLAHEISKILSILGSYNFLASLECVRSYAQSKGHSEPDLSSVFWIVVPGELPLNHDKSSPRYNFNLLQLMSRLVITQCDCWILGPLFLCSL